MNLLTFALADQSFGLDISRVQEVVEAPAKYYIPNAPDCFQGAINFHGEITPVLDLADFFDLEQPVTDHRLIVLRTPLGAMALAIGELRRIVPVAVEDLLPCDEQQEQEFCLQQLFNHDHQMINVLDLEKLLARLEAV